MQVRTEDSPVECTVDLRAIAHNMRRVSRLVPAGVGVLAVVKANAYGHGAMEISRTLIDCGASGLCVSTIGEAIELRESGLRAPILTLGPVLPNTGALYIEYGVAATVSGVGDVVAIAESAGDARDTATVHMKLDSGLHRYGACDEDADDVARSLRARPMLRIAGLYSHFADASRPGSESAVAQLRQFRRIAAGVCRALSVVRVPLHMAASAALLTMPDAHLDLVRPGALIYGVNPGVDPASMPAVRPAFSLTTRLAAVKAVRAGSPVGYDGWYRPVRDTLIGLIPMGYAHGYPRRLSGVAPVLVGSERRSIVGKIAMNCSQIDLGGTSTARVGDEVVLVGRQGDARVSIEELASCAGTIPEELLVGFSGRAPIRYIR